MTHSRRTGLTLLPLLLGSVLAFGQPAGGIYQSIVSPGGLPRLPDSVLDIGDPASRVSGTPGSFAIVDRSCNAASQAELRRRIVDTAVQEWAWFGFQVDDLRDTSPPSPDQPQVRRRFLPLDPDQVQLVAATVSGYWAAIPNSDWILARQNEAWQRPQGLAARWRDPWSAAFISWVMCESGTGGQERFQRAIAHHSYIDQAIRARDDSAPEALFTAYDPGEAEILPGDLICSGLRPVYRSLAQRRSQLGEGARTHCDIVVGVDDAGQRILTIGGNVRASVRLKIFPAAVEGNAQLAPLPTNRYIFAHLKLTAPEIAPDAWLASPSLSGGSCTVAGSAVASLPVPVATLLC